MTNTHTWTDNAMEAGVAQENPDIVNECLMHLKYDVDKDIIDLGTASSGTKTLSMDAVHKLIVSGAFTLALPTETTNKSRICRLRLTMSSIVSVAFPASVKWAYNVAPSLTSTTAVYILTFITEDGGTTWEGSCSPFGV